MKEPIAATVRRVFLKELLVAKESCAGLGRFQMATFAQKQKLVRFAISLLVTSGSMRLGPLRAFGTMWTKLPFGQEQVIANSKCSVILCPIPTLAAGMRHAHLQVISAATAIAMTGSGAMARLANLIKCAMRHRQYFLDQHLEHEMSSALTLMNAQVAVMAAILAMACA